MPRPGDGAARPRGTALAALPGMNPRSTMNPRGSRECSGRSSGSAELWGSPDRSRSWERPQQPHESARGAAPAPRALGARGGMARALPPPRASPVPRARPRHAGHPRPCLGIPGRAGHPRPGTLRYPVTPRPLIPQSRRSSRCRPTSGPPPLSVSPLHCCSPALPPLPGAAWLSRAHPALPPLPQRPLGARAFPQDRAPLVVRAASGRAAGPSGGTDPEPRDAREAQTCSRGTLRRHRPSAQGPLLPGTPRDRGAQETTRASPGCRHLGSGQGGPPLAGSGRAPRIDQSLTALA